MAIEDARVDEAMRREANATREAVQGFDWVASVPWISRFDINYAVAVDPSSSISGRRSLMVRTSGRAVRRPVASRRRGRCRPDRSRR